MTKSFLSDSVSISVECSKNLAIKCDRTHFIEVLNNLIYNAADALDKDGEIDIRFYKDKKRNYHVLSIHDNGQGIPKENLSRIFEPYFSTKNKDKNFGLGLFYSMNVIKEHNGYIDVLSSLGEGTTFMLYIPSKKIHVLRSNRL